MELIATNFRGISDPMSVSFTTNNRPVSMILYGDNGSGKSSLVDALEFALRGRLSRRNPEGQKMKREVKNFARPGAPGVIVKSDDGKSLRRGGGLAKSGVRETLQDAVDGFQYSPMIVRRQDIESFWKVPESERQAFFFDYLGNIQSFSERKTREKLEAKLQEAEEVLIEAADHLAELTDLPAGSLPKTFPATNNFLVRKLLPKYGTLDKETKRKRLPQRMWSAYLAFQGDLKKVEDLENQLARLPEPGPAIDSELTRILRSLTDRVTADFASVSRLDWAQSIKIVAGTESQLSIKVVLANGKQVDPPQILSEAYLDLLALLILVEVHIECVSLGQSPVIVLDDVFQSVDSVNRIRALDHILTRLKGWQAIITLHDRLWLELTKKAMQRANYTYLVREVIPEGYGQTPRLRDAIGRSADELRKIMENHDSPEAVSGCAGRVLEELCDGLSISLATKIARRPGDRYTIGDLWPGVTASLKKHGTTNIKVAVEAVHKFVDLRNIAGAHYNAFAVSLSFQEASDFGSICMALRASAGIGGRVADRPK
jgi:AAA domain